MASLKRRFFFLPWNIYKVFEKSCRLNNIIKTTSGKLVDIFMQNYSRFFIQRDFFSCAEIEAEQMDEIIWKQLERGFIQLLIRAWFFCD
jgi:hypothetical protein